MKRGAGDTTAMPRATHNEERVARNSVRRVGRLLNALNNDGRSGADSTECTERTEERTEWTERTERADGSHHLAKVRVAGSSPVVRSRHSTCSEHTFRLLVRFRFLPGH